MKVILINIGVKLGGAVLGITSLLASCASYDPAVDYRTRLEPFAASQDTAVLSARDFAVPEALDEKGWEDPTTGSVSERAEALMRQLAQQVKFDGSSPVPRPLTAANLWSKAKDGYPLNCLAASTLWAAIAQSQGLMARVLFLYPRDLSDENHVVVLIWDPVSRVWIVTDPSYQTLYYDAQGRTMGAAELRQALRAGEPIHLSGQACWNSGPVESGYLNYLSKNFYRWSALRSGGGHINLNPPSFNGFGPPWDAATVVHSPEEFLIGP